MMILKKIATLAAGSLLTLATAASAQRVQTQQIEAAQLAELKQAPLAQQRSLALQSLHQRAEQMKQSAQHPWHMQQQKQGHIIRGTQPLTPAQAMRRTAQSRAEELKAKYSISKGVYNMVPGYAYSYDQATGNYGDYSDRGIIAPPLRPIVFGNSSTGAKSWDWYYQGELLGTNDSIAVAYNPFLGNGAYFIPTPELTAYDAANYEDIYQAGYYYDLQNKKEVSGKVQLYGFGYAYNVDVDAAPFENTAVMSMGEDDWSNMLFGTDPEEKSSYVELFDQPLAPAFVEALYMYVLTPGNDDLSDAPFSIQFIEQSGNEVSIVAEADTMMAVLVDSDEDMGIKMWMVAGFLDQPAVMENAFGYIITGPQDGSHHWALYHQHDRTSQVNTAYRMPTEGEYKGYLMPYQTQDEAGNIGVYNTSIDAHLNLIFPYTLAMANGYILNTVDQLPAEGVETTPLQAVNWLTFYDGKPDLKAESKADWIKLKYVNIEYGYAYTYNFSVDPLPEGVTGRVGQMVFTDARGFEEIYTIHQGNTAGIDHCTADGKVALYCGEGSLRLSYPAEQYSEATLYDLQGHTVATYALPASGELKVATGQLGRGLYIVKLSGHGNSTALKFAN